MPKSNQIISDGQDGSFVVRLESEPIIGAQMPISVGYRPNQDVKLEGLHIRLQAQQAAAHGKTNGNTRVRVVVENEEIREFVLESNEMLFTARALAAISSKPIKLKKGRSMLLICETSESVKLIVALLWGAEEPRDSNQKC